MPRRTKKQDSEIVEYFYGINPKTYKVENVSLSRGGILSRWNDHGLYTHPVAGRNARSEVVIVFGLTEIESVTQVSFGGEYEKAIRKKLQEKADAMKAAAGQ